MKILIDTNIWLDILLNREAFFDASYATLCECVDSGDEATIAATSLKDIFYLCSNAYGADKAYFYINQILEIATVATVDEVVCRNAIPLEKPDYEDGIIAAVALADEQNLIISRDEQAFNNISIPKLSPSDFINSRGYAPVDF